MQGDTSPRRVESGERLITAKRVAVLGGAWARLPSVRSLVRRPKRPGEGRSAKGSRPQLQPEIGPGKQVDRSRDPIFGLFLKLSKLSSLSIIFIISSGSKSTPNGFSTNSGDVISAVASSFVSKQSTCVSRIGKRKGLFPHLFVVLLTQWRTATVYARLGWNSILLNRLYSKNCGK